MKNFIANIPIHLGNIINKFALRLIDFGIFLHISLKTRLGINIASFIESTNNIIKQKDKTNINSIYNDDDKLFKIIEGSDNDRSKT